MTEEAKQDEVQFKGLGFHRFLSDMVAEMIVEFRLVIGGMSGDPKCGIMVIVYRTILPTFATISKEQGSAVVEAFQSSWREIDSVFGSNFGFRDIYAEEATWRFDVIMKYLMDSGLIKLSTREEAWEDAFIEAIEDKMEREA